MSNVPDLVYSVSDFVAVANQSLEYAYPSVTITGELANYRVSKNRWVYFDLKDELASLRFFGTVYQLSGPLEDGMLLQVQATPKIHPFYGFSLTIQRIQLVGEGTIKRASALLEAKLAKEGLFDPSRKRGLPYPPKSIGLITSGESAAYADFTKIITARWSGLSVHHFDVQVQGADAPAQIIRAIYAANQHATPIDVLVLIRGGGSADDLQAFNEEAVVRAVAASRIPTLVAIGHENNISLAELAADVRASTPSNAAELLTPDKQQVLASLSQYKRALTHALWNLTESQNEALQRARRQLDEAMERTLHVAAQQVALRKGLIEAYNPSLALERGYAIIRSNHAVIRQAMALEPGVIVDIEMKDAVLQARIESKQKKE